MHAAKQTKQRLVPVAADDAQGHGIHRCLTTEKTCNARAVRARQRVPLRAGGLAVQLRNGAVGARERDAVDERARLDTHGGIAVWARVALHRVAAATTKGLQLGRAAVAAAVDRPERVNPLAGADGDAGDERAGRADALVIGDCRVAARGADPLVRVAIGVEGAASGACDAGGQVRG